MLPEITVEIGGHGRAVNGEDDVACRPINAIAVRAANPVARDERVNCTAVTRQRCPRVETGGAVKRAEDGPRRVRIDVRCKSDVLECCRAERGHKFQRPARPVRCGCLRDRSVNRETAAGHRYRAASSPRWWLTNRLATSNRKIQRPTVGLRITSPSAVCEM